MPNWPTITLHPFKHDIIIINILYKRSPKKHCSSVLSESYDSSTSVYSYYLRTVVLVIICTAFFETCIQQDSSSRSHQQVSSSRSHPAGLIQQVSSSRSHPAGLIQQVSSSRSHPAGLIQQVSSSRSHPARLISRSHPAGLIQQVSSAGLIQQVSFNLHYPLLLMLLLHILPICYI